MNYSELLTFANSVAPGDRPAAQKMLTEIELLLDMGAADLTEDSRRYLYKIRKRWEKRAQGTDTRWNTLGSKPGRTKNSSRRASATLRNEEEADPLLKSIMAKFGKPLPEDA